MILELNRTTGAKQKIQKISWQDQLRRQLYHKNRKYINQNTKKKQKNNLAQQKLQKILSQYNTVIDIKDKIPSDHCHSYYSSFIPLQNPTIFDDQLCWAIPYMKQLSQKGQYQDRNIFLQQIGEHIKDCSEKGQVQIGWQQVFQKYVCDIDTITAIQIYLELKKSFNQRIPQLMNMYNIKCIPHIFLARIAQVKKYFRNDSKKLKVCSVLAHKQINEVTISQTMKNLFCIICLTYDCGKHLIEQVVSQKNYQYVAPKNIISQQQKIKQAIILYSAYQNFKQNHVLLLNQPCQGNCYKLINNQKWQKIQNLRVRLASTLIKAIIQLGIQIYGYDPCKISLLLFQIQNKSTSQISCGLLFLYFIEDYQILKKLNNRLHLSQKQMLKSIKNISNPQQSIILTQKSTQKRYKSKKILQFHTAQNQAKISACCHYFIKHQTFDTSCQSCDCRKRGFCLPECLCGDQCPIKFAGCRCKKDQCRTKKCICFANQKQCDPKVCTNCFQNFRSQNRCKNNAILLKKTKKVRLGKSNIQGAGLGLFAAQPIFQQDFVMIYSGQIIDHHIDYLRQCLSVDKSFYNFGSPEGTIDARFMGNLSRFINHGDNGNQNLTAVKKLTGGHYRIAFYALKDIQIGQQLFFDYDGGGQLYLNFKDKYPFINAKKKSSIK